MPYILFMNSQVPIRLFNRDIAKQDIGLINNLIKTEGSKGRTHISKKLCHIWQWRNASGQFRDIACRQLLLKLENKGHIKLPPPLKRTRQPGYKNKTKIPYNLDKSAITGKLNELPAISFDMVRGNKDEALFNGLIGEFHYLGYHQGNGQQLKYIVYSQDRIIAAIGFAASAYKTAPRDNYIGWDEHTRKTNLVKVVNNNRFLILPWVNVKNLASYILGYISRNLKDDWQNYHQSDIVLMETFVETGRFKGTCYKAANWIYLGQTKGRTRNDRYSQIKVPIKDIYIYPLTKSHRKVLTNEQ
jgi:hypothetical protein